MTTLQEIAKKHYFDADGNLLSDYADLVDDPEDISIDDVVSWIQNALSFTDGEADGDDDIDLEILDSAIKGEEEVVVFQIGENQYGYYSDGGTSEYAELAGVTSIAEWGELQDEPRPNLFNTQYLADKLSGGNGDALIWALRMGNPSDIEFFGLEIVGYNNDESGNVFATRLKSGDDYYLFTYNTNGFQELREVETVGVKSIAEWGKTRLTPPQSF